MPQPPLGRAVPGGPGGPCTFDQLIPDLAVERLRARVATGQPFTCEAETRLERRTIALAVQITEHVGNDVSSLVFECQNVWKTRELEYMIWSYLNMVEKQNPQSAAGEGTRREAAAQPRAEDRFTGS